MAACLLCLAGHSLALQPDKRFADYVGDTWGIEHGLPQVSVLSITQDRDGYLWLGSQGGLARYELRPRTGLRHQLRAQMNALGLPLLGDRIYPLLQPHENPPRLDAPLQLLARAIAFTDPVTGEQRRFERAALTIPAS